MNLLEIKPKPHININQFFVFCVISVISLGWIALTLALLGFFYTSILAIFAIISISILIYIGIKNRKHFKFSREFILVTLFALILTTILSYFTTPSIFSGRDQGSYSNAAISLSQNHSLKSSFPAQQEFFKIYGPGTALNFPGFSYDKIGNLTPHLSAGYISWLAIFYSFFGIYGFVIANTITFFIFLISFFLISKNYLESRFALIAFFLVSTSFIFSWFFKYTLSENLALGLIWFGILQLINFLKEKNNLSLFSFLLSFGLLFLVRIEAIAFIIITLIILFFHKDRNLILKIIFEKKILFCLFFIFAIFIFNFKINNAFYISFTKGFIHSFNFSNHNPTTETTSPFEGIYYLVRVLSIYTLINYLILGLIGFYYFLKKKKYQIIIPYIILLPTFFYLIDPSITLDHPWMLRRYVFAVIPISILYTVLFLKNFIRKKIFFYILSFFLFLTNLMTMVPYIPIKENSLLLAQIEKISLNFENNDLILIDRGATGDPWSMMTGPMNLLFGKQAVYFFNPEDLKKIDQSKFDKIYLIVPDFNLELYTESWLKEKLVFVKNYDIENDSLNTLNGKKNELYKKPVTLPLYQKKYTYGKIYLLKN